MYCNGFLNGFLNDTRIFMEYETGAIADHMTLVRLLISLKNSSSTIVQIYFQSSSEELIGFIVCDTRYLWFFFEY